MQTGPQQACPSYKIKRFCVLSLRIPCFIILHLPLLGFGMSGLFFRFINEPDGIQLNLIPPGRWMAAQLETIPADGMGCGILMHRIAATTTTTRSKEQQQKNNLLECIPILELLLLRSICDTTVGGPSHAGRRLSWEEGRKEF